MPCLLPSRRRQKTPAQQQLQPDVENTLLFAAAHLGHVTRMSKQPASFSDFSNLQQGSGQPGQPSWMNLPRR